MKNILILLSVFTILLASPALGQHHSTDSISTPARDTPDMMNMHHGIDGMDMSGMNMSMNHAFSLNLPMSRNGSGTGWLPDASPDVWLYATQGFLDVYVSRRHIPAV